MDETGDDLIRRAFEPERPDVVAGRYELVDEIGRGGFGSVWRALDRTLGREVALKLLKINEPEEVARFELEARVAAKLRHAHVVSVHDVGRHDGRPYLVMDLIDGRPMSALVSTLGADQLGRILAKAARGLGAAHAAGVVHRDVKPGNILVDAGGEPFVTDFGLAKPLDGDSGVKTVTGAIMGTPMYMAPEQAAGELQRISPRSDVFSLGVCLYEILTKRNPFLAHNVHQILARVRSYDPPPPSRRGKRVPVELDWVCLKALEKDPARRYADANEFAEDLERFYRGENVTARPASLMYRAAKRVRRNPWAWGMGAAGLALIAVAAIAGREWKQSEEELLRARLETALRRAERDVAVIDLELATREQPANPLLQALDPITREIEDILTALPDVDGLRTLAQLYRRRGSLAAALSALERARLLRPTDSRIHFDLGVSLLELARRRLGDRVGVDASTDRDQIEGDAMRIVQQASSHFQSGGFAEPWTRAVALAAESRFEEALEVCRDQQRRGSLSRDGLGFLAMLALQDHRWAEAAEAFDAAHAAWKSDWESMAQKAESLLLLAEDRRLFGQDEVPVLLEAIEWLERAAVVKTDDARTHNHLGWARWRLAQAMADLGRSPESTLRLAVDHLSKAIDLAPEDPQAWANRGGARCSLAERLESVGRDSEEAYDLAIKDFDRAVTLNSHTVTAVTNRAYTRCKWANQRVQRGLGIDSLLEDAHRDILSALSINADYAPASSVRGQLLMLRAELSLRRGADASGLVKEAIEAYDRAMTLDPADTTYRVLRADAKILSADALLADPADRERAYRSAIDDLTQALRQRPFDAEAIAIRGTAWAGLATVRESLGEAPWTELIASIEDFSKAVDINGVAPTFWNNRGTMRKRMGVLEMAVGRDPRASFEAAAADFGEALKLKPDYVSAKMNRGIVNLALGDFERNEGRDAGRWARAAVTDLESAVAGDPSRWQSHANLAAACHLASLTAGGVSTKDGLSWMRRAESAIRAALDLNPQAPLGPFLDEIKSQLEAASEY